jgi:hypothetical protein
MGRENVLLSKALIGNQRQFFCYSRVAELSSIEYGVDEASMDIVS